MGLRYCGGGKCGCWFCNCICIFFLNREIGDVFCYDIIWYFFSNFVIMFRGNEWYWGKEVVWDWLSRKFLL